MANYSVARLALEEDRTKLIHQLSDLGTTENGELRKGLYFGGGFADAAASTAERTEVLGLVDTLKSHVDDLDQALDRSANDGYGVCYSCGSQILPERMEARPISGMCINCKTPRS